MRAHALLSVSLMATAVAARLGGGAAEVPMFNATATATAPNPYPVIARRPGDLSQSAGCQCAGGKLTYYTDYEIIPHDQKGSACIGGCGGAPFEFNKRGAMIRRIQVWTGDSPTCFRGLRVNVWNDDTDYNYGTTLLSSSPTVFEFSPGEHLVGDLTLSGNGIGTRTGYMEFHTSLNKSFKVGNGGNDKYNYPTGDSFLAGFFGQEGSDIDHMGVLLWKPVASSRITSISYPTLDSLARIKSPATIADHTYCNDNSVDRTFESYSEEHTVQTGSTNCFKASASFTFGEETTVSGGVPEMEKVSETMKWSVTAGVEFSNCGTTTDTKKTSLTFPSVTMKPHTRTQYVFSQWQGTLDNLPFNAVVAVTFKDGTSWKQNQQGSYHGARYISIDSYYTNEETGVKSCAH